jgi:hypothetical protein
MKYFVLYPFIKIVLGKRRSIILNTLDNSIQMLPIPFIPIIKLIETHNIIQLEKVNITPDLLTSFTDYFIKNDLGVLLDKKCIPNLDLKFKISNLIDVVEIELSQILIIKFDEIYTKLNLLKGITIFIIVKAENTELLGDVLKKFYYHNRPINLLLCLNVKKELYSEIDKIHSNYKSRLKIFINGSKYEFQDKTENNCITVLNASSKVKISANIYNTSQREHPYFSSRIFIDCSCKYSSCYKDENTIGNFFEDSFEIIVQSLIQNKFWQISRDLIVDCNECEFRYSCLDNSTPIFVKENYFLSEKCKYSPYES